MKINTTAVNVCTINKLKSCDHCLMVTHFQTLVCLFTSFHLQDYKPFTLSKNKPQFSPNFFFFFCLITTEPAAVIFRTYRVNRALIYQYVRHTEKTITLEKSGSGVGGSRTNSLHFFYYYYLAHLLTSLQKQTKKIASFLFVQIMYK